MTVESDLYAALGALVSNRVYPDTMPMSTTLPAIVYQQVGGEALAFVELAMPSKKHGRFQIRAWASTRLAAAALARSIEDTLCMSTVLRASAIGALISDFEEDMNLFGTIQDFSIWFDD